MEGINCRFETGKIDMGIHLLSRSPVRKHGLAGRMLAARACSPILVTGPWLRQPHAPQNNITCCQNASHTPEMVFALMLVWRSLRPEAHCRASLA
jgi:hypothetical protein